MSATTTTTIIPTIDISPFLNGTDKKSVAEKVGQACEDIGFFTISGHGIDLSLLTKVKDNASAFFDLPLSTKQQTTAPFGLGYMGEGIENVGATLKDDSTAKDTKESLNLTLPISDEVWPATPPELRCICETYYKAIQNLAAQLMKLFALALHLDEGFFDDKVNHPYTCLRLLHYPPQKTQTDTATTRNAEHTDYGTLTILWSPDVRGLQAQSRLGEWIDVICPPDQFIINIGDLMMNWTNDKWISTLHRVVPHAATLGERRFSVPFFHNPNPEAVIECIESCCGEGRPKKYGRIIAKEHLEMKVSKALGQEEKMG